MKKVTINNIPNSMISNRVMVNPGRGTVRTLSAVNKAEAPAGLNNEFTSLKEAAAAVHRIRISVQNELELARKLREDAQRYKIATETRARSEAQQVILNARLSIQKQSEEMIRQASEEIQKLLADIRVIRITAQEELAAQRKFTDAARLCSMTMAMKDENSTPEVRRKKQPPAARPKNQSS